MNNSFQENWPDSNLGKDCDPSKYSPEYIWLVVFKSQKKAITLYVWISTYQYKTILMLFKDKGNITVSIWNWSYSVKKQIAI